MVDAADDFVSILLRYNRFGIHGRIRPRHFAAIENPPVGASRALA